MSKTFVFSDLHGQYELWRQIKEYMQPDDKAYCLGDCVDRGPDGIKILTEILADKRITLIKGNHENLMEICLSEYITEECMRNSYWWFANGGKKTWTSIEKYSIDDMKVLLSQLQKLPERIDIEKDGRHIILTHAGCDPWEENPKYIKYPEDNLYLWDRHHIYSKWDKKYDDTYIIHGHTPTLTHYFGVNEEVDTGEEASIVKYADGHKICIDLGAFFTGRTALLDLDTLEPIYFDTEVQ